MKGKDKDSVIMVATSHRTRGGVTAVVQAYERAEALRPYRILWVETHIDRCLPLKAAYFLSALIHYAWALPSGRIVHIHISTPVSAFRKLFFLFPAKLMGKKIITHIHCDIPETHIADSSFARRLYPIFFRWSHCILVLSETWKKYLTEKAIGVKATVEVLYNPACPVEPRLLAEERKYVLFVGTLIPRKRWFDLLRAFRHVADVHPDWQLVFGGSGSIAEGKHLAKTLGIADKVEFRGWVGEEEKRQLFREAAIVCLPSYSEGFPMAVVEAWAYGLPVVCTSVGGLSDVIRDEETALLVEAGDIAGIARQLERLISDGELRRSLGEAGRDLAENVFGLPHIGGRLAEIYDSLSK
jgi:glycosyltransferase involved in cell wall biosynthesis